MHPNRTFDWNDSEAMLDFLQRVSFCTIFVAGAEPRVVHAPIVVTAPDRLCFHISRANRAGDFDGARGLVSCLGGDAYISPDWYGAPGQVPTWNYVAVEAEGPLRRLDEEELAAFLDALSTQHEARLAPKEPWTRTRMAPGLFETMLKGIVGYEMRIADLRGTRKLGQHKKTSEIAGVIAGLEGAGRSDFALLTGEVL